MQSTTPQPPEQSQNRPYLVRSTTEARTWLQTCPHAQTLSALCPELQTHVLIILPCKQWGCPHCARRKIAELASRTRDAQPNRLLTLTVDPSLHDCPRAAFDATRTQVPELIRRLRQRFGEIEYLRVTELTKRGYPHYHLLVRSRYLPQPVVKQLWSDLTGAKIVDLRQVKKTFAAYSYLVKYLSKLHKIEWTERHVSYSRRFFPQKDADPKAPYTFEQTQRLAEHPATALATHYEGMSIKRLSPSLIQILAEGESPHSTTPDPF